MTSAELLRIVLNKCSACNAALEDSMISFGFAIRLKHIISGQIEKDGLGLWITQSRYLPIKLAFGNSV